MFQNFFSSFSRGFSFIKQSIEMASKDRDLIKPSLMLVAASMLVTFVSLVPMIAIAITLRGDAQQALLGIFGALMIFVQYVLTYFFSGLTIALIYSYITKGDGRMDEATEAVKRNFTGILTLAAVSTVVQLIENAARNRKNLLANILAGILEAVWTTASYLILPAMIIENLSLWPAIKRTAMIIKNNFLLVGVGYVGVGAVMGLFSFLVVIAMLMLAVTVFAIFSAIHVIAGIVAAVLVVGTVGSLLGAVSAYINTAYYTCLFMWARDVEQANGRQPDQILAPGPLATAMAAR